MANYRYNEQQRGSECHNSFLIICVVTGGWMMGEKLIRKKDVARSDHALFEAVPNI
jgi:hypothetical protein